MKNSKRVLAAVLAGSILTSMFGTSVAAAPNNDCRDSGDSGTVSMEAFGYLEKYVFDSSAAWKSSQTNTFDFSDVSDETLELVLAGTGILDEEYDLKILTKDDVASLIAENVNPTMSADVSDSGELVFDSIPKLAVAGGNQIVVCDASGNAIWTIPYTPDGFTVSSQEPVKVTPVTVEGQSVLPTTSITAVLDAVEENSASISVTSDDGKIPVLNSDVFSNAQFESEDFSLNVTVTNGDEDYTWSFTGGQQQGAPATVDLSLSKNTEATVSEGVSGMALTLNHSGNFPTQTANLTISVGSAFENGATVNLWYNNNGIWENMTQSSISVVKGKVTLPFTHASHYAVVSSDVTAEQMNGITEPEKITKLTAKLDSTSKTISVGESSDFSLNVQDQNGQVVDSGKYQVVWSINGSSAQITDSGKLSATVVAVEPGTSTVAVTVTLIGDDSISDTATATVLVEENTTEPEITVEVEPSSVSLSKDDKATLVATVKVNGIVDSGKPVEWSSSDPSIATVNANGTVTAVAVGSATITATVTGTNAFADCAVTVTESAQPQTPVVTLNKSTLNLTEGDTEQLIASVTVNGTSVTDRVLSWNSSDNTIATVENGLVTAVKEGTAQITVTVEDGNSAVCTVTVGPKEPVATVITLDKTSATLYTNRDPRSVTVKATVTPVGTPLSWSVDNSNVTVAAGSEANTVVVTAKAVGTSVITFTAEDGTKATCTITVKRYSSGSSSSGGSSSSSSSGSGLGWTGGITILDGSQGQIPSGERVPWDGVTTGPTGGVLMLDTSTYTMAPNGIYDIKMTLLGASVSDVKVYSSRDGIATVTALGDGKYRITGVNPGDTYIMFEVYRDGVLVNHASVKVTIAEGAAAQGTSNRFASFF